VSTGGPMRVLTSLMVAFVFAVPAASMADVPMSVFVVHCEPTNANETLWGELEALVALADRHNVPLSIDVTAQWAEMIVADEDKIAVLERWIDAGHEIACHHHPYWSTMDRPATWDGYTNTPINELLLPDRAEYRGTMDEYMALLAALPGERRSGCLGGSDARDEADWPCALVYSTVGHAIEDAVSRPVGRSMGSCDVVELGHALIVGVDRGALRTRYEATGSDAVFGVVGHVYNYAELPMAFEQWFATLYERDPIGQRRGTVSGVLDEWTAAD
jgi:hypothetical protein